MKIKWYGHAAFLITSDRGVKIMTDPYDPDAYAEKLTKPRMKRLEPVAQASTWSLAFLKSPLRNC